MNQATYSGVEKRAGADVSFLATPRFQKQLATAIAKGGPGAAVPTVLQHSSAVLRNAAKAGYSPQQLAALQAKIAPTVRSFAKRVERGAYLAAQTGEALTPGTSIGTYLWFGKSSPVQAAFGGGGPGLQAARGGFRAARTGGAGLLRSTGAGALRGGAGYFKSIPKAMRAGHQVNVLRGLAKSPALLKQYEALQAARAAGNVAKAARLAKGLSLGSKLGIARAGLVGAGAALGPAMLGFDALGLGLESLSEPGLGRFYSKVKGGLGGGVLGTLGGAISSAPHLLLKSMPVTAYGRGRNLLEGMDKAKGLGKAMRVAGSGLLSPLSAGGAAVSAIGDTFSTGKRLRQTRGQVDRARAMLRQLRQPGPQVV